MSFICADAGASSTRFTGVNGEYSVIPNNTAFVPLDYENKMIPNSDSIEYCLDVIIEKTEGTTNFFPLRALIGNMAERCDFIIETPSMNQNKHVQKINYVSVLTAVAVTKLAEIANGKEDKTPVKLFVDLPPLEVKTATEIVQEEFLGKWRITLPKFNNTVLEFEIGKVVTCSESLMAMSAFFFNKNGSFRSDSSGYVNGYVLSLDIGASTTDLIIVKDTKPLERSAQTYKLGGNLVIEELKDVVRGKYGFELSPDMALTLVTEGRLQSGNTYIDMSEELDKVKKEFAGRIVNMIQNYFTKVSTPLQSIKAIFVSGGGSMRSEYTDADNKSVITSPAITKYITDSLKTVCPGVDVVDFPENPRFANIIGTYLRANTEELIEKQRALAASETNK